MMKDKIVSVHLRTREQADRPKVKGLGVLYCTPWNRIYADESQKFANPTTKIYKVMMALYGEYKWCLTGTPIRNYDTDIWAQLRFCGYTGVTVTNEWRKGGNAKFKDHNLNQAIHKMDAKGAGLKLPPKNKYATLIALKGKHKDVYEIVLGITRKVYDMVMANAADVGFSCILAMFTRLRQCVIAPYLLTAESKRDKIKDKEVAAQMAILMSTLTKGDYGKWIHEKKGGAGMKSAKIQEIVRTISLVTPGEKVLIFSMFTSALDLMADALKEYLPEFTFVQVDGKVKGRERDDLIDQFRIDPNTRGLLLSYKVGSEGLNLTEACHVITMEPWWTPAVHLQAEARAWRTGQTKPVHIHNIYIAESIEEKVLEICVEKIRLAATYLEGSEKRMKKNAGLDKYTLGKILGIHE